MVNQISDSLHHIIRHPALEAEAAASNEHNNRVHLVFFQSAQRAHGLHVPGILAAWILKPVPFPVLVEFLSPVFLVRPANNCAVHVFGLNHKNAKNRDEDVVHLSGAIFSWQGDILD